MVLRGLTRYREKMAIIFFAFILIGPGKYSIDRQ
jgi:hypothetical protein